MWSVINDFLVNVDNFVWGVPLMVLIMAGGFAAYGAPRSVTDSEASPCAEMDDPE